MEPEDFFPIGTGAAAGERIERAKAVCADCAVRVDCLAWALEHGHDAGVWGGLDAEQRRTLRAHRLGGL